MVDVSSSCMELALKVVNRSIELSWVELSYNYRNLMWFVWSIQEKRELKQAARNGVRSENSNKGCPKMLWRAFQLAYRVYTFAGGHDERADRLTRELALEIESESQDLWLNPVCFKVVFSCVFSFFFFSRKNKKKKERKNQWSMWGVAFEFVEWYLFMLLHLFPLSG